MTLQDLGSIGELLGGIAVVLSFLYLALQVRHNTQGLDQNTETMRLSFENEIRRELIEFRQSIATDERLSAVWTRGLAGEELNPSESGRFELLMMNFTAMLTARFFAHRRGIYELDRAPFFYVIAQTPGFKRWWKARAKVVAPTPSSDSRNALHDYIRSHMESADPSGPNATPAA